MKSFVAFPLEVDKALLPRINSRCTAGKPIPHIELFKKVRSLDGSIVKCGIAAEEGFSQFLALKQVMKPTYYQTMVAFEKFTGELEFKEGTSLRTRINNSAVSIKQYQQAMVQKGKKENVTFIPGHVDDSIATYLIENPELKISYLNIDLDDYDMTTTCLEFFYPRLIIGGILILDNYHKQQEDYKAVHDYFFARQVNIKCFTSTEGPHYLIRN